MKTSREKKCIKKLRTQKIVNFIDLLFATSFDGGSFKKNNILHKKYHFFLNSNTQSLKTEENHLENVSVNLNVKRFWVPDANFFFLFFSFLKKVMDEICHYTIWI